MGPIQLSRTIKEASRQIWFLHNFFSSLALESLHKLFISLLFLSAILVGISAISDQDYWITYYVVIGGLWVIFGITFISKLWEFEQKELWYRSGLWNGV